MEHIIQKIDKKIKRLKASIISDKKRIEEELNKSPSDYKTLNLLRKDIELSKCAIVQLEWVLSELNIIKNQHEVRK